MGQALYRKYRSRSFDEVIGQDHIVTTLQNALQNGRISHAYLFTGPRGVGKTSVARILAHAVNDLPYEGEHMHLDIIEIDAASNRRIDEIRELRDRVHVTPTTAKYKVYIIDEVHMLTKEAFNALLKTLEEPPAHCIFILATTELHKVPETIISRTQRLHFKPISTEQAMAHLRELAQREKIKIDDEALQLLARHGSGSFRDSISLLDQIRSSSQSTINADVVREALGLPSDTAIVALHQSVQNHASTDVVEGLDELLSHGYTAGQIAAHLSAFIRDRILQGSASELDIALLRSLLQVSASHQPAQMLEICLLEQAVRSSPESSSVKAPSPPVSTKSTAKPVEHKPEQTELPKPKPAQATADKQADVTVGSQEKPTGGSELSSDDWPTILEAIQPRSSALYRALRLAVADYADKTLTLRFAFALHKKKVDTTEHKKLLSAAIHELGFTVPALAFAVDKTVKPTPVAPSEPEIVLPKQDDPQATISNIFGGAELLES